MIEGMVRTSFQPSVPFRLDPSQSQADTRRHGGTTPTAESNAGVQDGQRSSTSPAAVLELSSEEERVVQQLRTQDREVRQHEQAHLAAAGRYATSGAQFQYTTGPDGKRYAVGGEVSIDTSPESTPEETLRKAQAVQRAALAPAEPSSQDRAIAAQAARLETQSKQEINQERIEELRGSDETVQEAASGSPAEESNRLNPNQSPTANPSNPPPATDRVGEIIDLFL